MATDAQPSAAAKPGLRKPVFVKVDSLKPGTYGHTLTAKVLEANDVVQKGGSGSGAVNPARQSRIAECLIGDETGTVLFTARNDQAWNVNTSVDCEAQFDFSFNFFCLPVDLMKPGATIILRNSKIDMFKGSMRLAVDKWGRVEVTEPGSFEVKEDNNLSLVEYELVNVADE
ncbi:hypothetical protein RHSIM_Rhsim06G0203000 [Rhododendron simsii]|uniref:Single-stranded DNA binding protein Ssb-like OB fold domain-containing protein n=1 Tax=Rhododendron simsii TaxID=118357 RepID=A0A834GY94_RHOSS|nr:hypothetical protein RHSIM_Rhsim06G0203000 [Rhododendron simsii]